VTRSRRAGLVAGGILLVGLAAVAGRDHCARRTPGPPEVLVSAFSSGPLLAGAASVPLDIPFPAVVAGYGVPRATVSAARVPVRARALVVQSGAVRVGVVALDILVGDAGLQSEIRSAVADLGLTDLWVAVTHTHSGPGGYASNRVAELAGTGLLRREVRDAVVSAAAGALTSSARKLAPVTLHLGEGTLDGLIGARSPPADVDPRLTRLVLDGQEGPVAQLLILACHPTLVPRPPPGLDPDWPGRLADREGELGHGLTLVLQGAVGNASAALTESNGERLGHFVAAVAAAADALPLAPVPAALGVARASVGLPGPDASRLAPSVARPLVANLLCASAPARSDVALLRLGPLLLLGVPAEPSASAGRVLEEAAGASRAVSLVDGYLGYVETPEHLGARVGESERQLLGPSFLDALARAGRAARASLPP